MRILAIGAHPDDVEILMFGTLAACRARGDDVGWIVATDGSKGSTGERVGLAAHRRRESQAAAALLEVVPVFLDEPDGGLSDRPETRARLEDEIGRFGPDLILTHAPEDYHPDHRALSGLVRSAAAFRAPVAYADTLAGIGFLPNLLVDVTAHRSLKRSAILKHRSQDPGRLASAAEIVARFRGLQANGRAEILAEAYRFEPAYPFGDIRHLLPYRFQPMTTT